MTWRQRSNTEDAIGSKRVDTTFMRQVMTIMATRQLIRHFCHDCTLTSAEQSPLQRLRTELGGTRNDVSTQHTAQRTNRSGWKKYENLCFFSITVRTVIKLHRSCHMPPPGRNCMTYRQALAATAAKMFT
jgi:hypothetical protein